MQILADSGNSDTIAVGGGPRAEDDGTPTITVNSADATDGFPLAAGQGLFLPVDDASKIWLVSASGTQSVHFIIR